MAETALTTFDPIFADEQCTDNDDITPAVGRISANLKEGRFYKRDGQEKIKIGDELRVVMLSSKRTARAYPPTPDEDFKHPFKDELLALNFTPKRAFCRNPDRGRFDHGLLAMDVTDEQKSGLKELGWTGKCGGCIFANKDPETGVTPCEKFRDLLVQPESEDLPSVLSIRGASIGAYERLIQRSFFKGLKRYRITARPVKFTFEERESKKNGFEYKVMTGVAEDVFHAEEATQFWKLRELYNKDFEEYDDLDNDDEPGPSETSTTDTPPPETPLTDEEAVQAAVDGF